MGAVERLAERVQAPFDPANGAGTESVSVSSVNAGRAALA
jgi:hypothetical protein